MSSAMCWKNVDVVRPQPGQAVTCGLKLLELERLQDLLRDLNFFGSIAAGLRRE